MVIGGTNSNIEEDITNKVISQIYPEFIDGSADGVVSLESAYLKGADEFFLRLTKIFTTFILTKMF